MEHPEQYSEEQWQELLSDEECRELYETMRLSASAFEAEDAKEKIANDIKEEEWQKFETAHPTLRAPHLLRRGIRYQVAAVFIGLLMLSGIAYAAVQMVRQSKVGGDLKSPTQEVPRRDGSLVATKEPSLIADSIAQPRIFENTPLDEMVTEIAHYYNKVADIQNPQAHELRFYFVWTKEDGIAATIEKLNNFESVNIELTQDKLILK